MPLDAQLLWFSEAPTRCVTDGPGLVTTRLWLCASWPTGQRRTCRLVRYSRIDEEWKKAPVLSHRTSQARRGSHKRPRPAVSPTAGACHAPPGAGHDQWNQGSGLPLGSVHVVICASSIECRGEKSHVEESCW